MSDRSVTATAAARVIDLDAYRATRQIVTLDDTPAKHGLTSPASAAPGHGVASYAMTIACINPDAAGLLVRYADKQGLAAYRVADTVTISYLRHPSGSDRVPMQIAMAAHGMGIVSLDCAIDAVARGGSRIDGAAQA